MSQSFQSFIGVDLHKCTVTLTAVDQSGEKISRIKISTKSTGKIEDWLLYLPRPSWMAVEARPFLDWFIDRFKPCVDRIDIADATALANLLCPPLSWKHGKRVIHPPAMVDERPLQR